MRAARIITSLDMSYREVFSLPASVRIYAAEGEPPDPAWGNEYREVDCLTDLPEALADDEAANHAIDQAARREWFTLEAGERFSLFYSWDTPSDMEAFLHEEWDGFVVLEEEVGRAAKSAWAVANADARVRVRVGMIINRWRKS